MRKICSVAVLVAAVAVSAAGLAWESPACAKQNSSKEQQISEVKIDNFSFAPQSLTVPVGSTVTWTNRDDIPHTVVSSEDPKSFRSRALDTDEKFSFTFSKPGTYPYFCSIHPKMTGKVIVN